MRNWLENAGLAQYADVFLQNGWETTDALVLIQEANLKEMGVKPGHRAVILNHIQYGSIYQRVDSINIELSFY